MGKRQHRPDTAGMDRREVLRRLMAGAGASAAAPVLGNAAPHAGEREAEMAGMAMPQGEPLGSAQPPDPQLSSKNWKPKFFDEHENETVVVLSDLIIPDTDTPGAKAALANRFIDLLLNTANPDFQKQYLQALGWLDGFCLSKYSNPFTKLDPAQQKEVLTLLTHKSDDPKIAYGANLFRLIKGSIVEAFYSSEIGTLQELKYETNPFHTEFPGCKNPDEH